jgi:defect-in-organelle-trafficking protein DotC
MPNFIRSINIIALSALLMACSSTRYTKAGDTESLKGLESMSAPKAKANRTGSGKIREMAIRDTALSLGAQSGLAWRAKIIDEELVKETRNLDAIFDFNSLILANNIIPPVLLEGRNTLNLADPTTIRVSDRSYKIAKQAHFITTAPNWRQYLWLDYNKPERPNVTLLPKSKEEKAAWKECVQKGWKSGIMQANIILEESLARIKEDFNGMIMYRKLLAMNMISAPFVSHTELGVTGDGSEIHIDDRVLRIAALPTLNTNSGEWQAAVAKDYDALERFKKMEKQVESAQIKISSKAWQPTIAPIQ